MMIEKKWQFTSENEIGSWADFCQLIWQNRGFTDTDWQEEEREKAIEVSLGAVNIAAGEVKKAIKKILTAQEENKEIVIYGDYDVDGNCSAAIMWQGLRELGITSTPFIPHRLRHGYGLKKVALEEIFRVKKPGLIITVDNGISASEALRYCYKNKVEVIITDHHLINPDNKEHLSAQAIVHTTDLCGAGVAWFLVRQLWRGAGVVGWEEKASGLLDLVCLATIADQVPLKKYNRLLVKEGLKVLQKSQRPGIIELCKVSRLKQSELKTENIGFSLGPKINAIGRLTNTLEALRLLCTNNPGRATTLAQRLTQVNSQRQELTEEMFETAKKEVEREGLDKIIMVASEKFHEGIVGLIASRLVDIYARPVIVASLDQKVGKASCRSIEGINITALLREFREELIDVGGHEMAAGFSFARKNLGAIKKALKKEADKISSEQLVPKIEADAWVKIGVLQADLLQDFMQKLEPFGAGNPAIKVGVRGKIADFRFLGSEQQHLQINLIDSEGAVMKVLFWHYQKYGWSKPRRGVKIAVIGELKTDEYRGRVSAAIFAQDYKKLT